MQESKQPVVNDPQKYISLIYHYKNDNFEFSSYDEENVTQLQNVLVSMCDNF